MLLVAPVLNLKMELLCRQTFPAITVFLLLTVAACGTSGTSGNGAREATVPTSVETTPNKATRTDILQSLTAKVIIPGYDATADGMAQLEQSADALCASPSDARLKAARDGWRNARQAWLRTESYRFGPAMDRRSMSLVDWWPIDPQKIDRNLAGDDTVTEERVSEFMSATQRGLGTAEYLLFEPESVSLAGGSDIRQRCAYLQSVVSVARDEVDGILADWRGEGETEGYASYYDGTGSTALLDREAEAEAVRSLVFQVRAIANMRLGAALGIDGEADASAIPTGYADNTREDLLSQLDSIAVMYRGADGGLGLSARVNAVSEETNSRMLTSIESTAGSVGNLDGSIISQLETDPAQVREVYDNMKELQRILNTEIVSLLGVSVGFADTDGDS